MDMELQEQIAVLKTGTHALTQKEFDVVYELFKQRINRQCIEGSLLLPHGLRQGTGIADVTNILESLVEHGFIRFEWVFWDNDDCYAFEELEDDEKADLVAQLEKSKAAKEKYGRYTAEYEANRGGIYHPEYGSGHFDPLEHLGKRYYYTNKLKVDPSLVAYNANDKDQAMKELFPEELLPELEKRAQAIAMERLGL